MAKSTWRFLLKLTICSYGIQLKMVLHKMALCDKITLYLNKVK